MSEDLPTPTKGRKSGIVAIIVSGAVAAGGSSGLLAMKEAAAKSETRIEQLEREVASMRVVGEETDRRARASESDVRELRSLLTEVRSEARETNTRLGDVRERLIALCGRVGCR